MFMRARPLVAASFSCPLSVTGVPASSPIFKRSEPEPGYHWFEHADQPAEGRFDGENSNFGTVTIEDNVYAELTETMTRVNAAAEQIHAETAQAD
jgi:hypothetical protein